MSSFKRAVKPAAVPVPGPGQEVAESSSPAPLREAPITGAKPWVSTGLGIVSTGNKQLDDLVGGGTALGTLALIESDCFSNYGETLLLYNLAEAASHQQPILLIAEDNVEAERLITALPYNQTVGSSGANDVAHAENSGGDDTNKLTIAWQYSKYLKNTGNENERKATASVDGEAPAASYCSSYDLSRRLQASMLSRARIDLCLAESVCNAQEPGMHSDAAVDRCFASIAQAVRTFVSGYSSGGRMVSRVVIAGLEQVLAQVASSTGSPVSSRSAARFVLQLKHIIRAHRVSLTVTLNTSAVSVETAVRVRQIADTLLSVESFAGCAHSVPYEFKEFQGFLVVHKIQHYGSIAPFRPPGTRFGLKRDRRKLHIEPLHLPPEESRAFSTTGGAAPASSSTAGVGATASAGKTAEENATAHTHSHEHGYHAETLPAPSAGTASSAASIAPAAEAAAVPMTPLQASLAALKAARQAAASSGPASLSAPAFAPISIQRPPSAVTSTAGSRGSGSVAASVGSASSASGSSAGGEGRTPPLQPGQACGAQLRPGQASSSQYDF